VKLHNLHVPGVNHVSGLEELFSTRDLADAHKHSCPNHEWVHAFLSWTNYT